MEHQLTTPLTKEKCAALKAGDTVRLSGTIYTARDAAHARLVELVQKGESLPFDIKDAIIYYAGPAPAPTGAVIGSCGPTTSSRMDAYAPTLLALGLQGMIGKGARNAAVVQAMQASGAVYFGATGGAGALIAQCIQSAELVCYEDLGSEAVRKLTVKDMPLTVIIDATGANLYQTGPEKYLAQI